MLNLSTYKDAENGRHDRVEQGRCFDFPAENAEIRSICNKIDQIIPTFLNKTMKNSRFDFDESQVAV